MSKSTTNNNGVSLLMFHCLFNDGGSITHFSHKFLPELYDALSNLYVVCIVNRSEGIKKAVGAFVIKTSLAQDNPNFLLILKSTVATEPRLINLIDSDSSLLATKLNVPVGKSISENEMLELMMRQAILHGTVGAA